MYFGKMRMNQIKKLLSDNELTEETKEALQDEYDDLESQWLDKCENDRFEREKEPNEDYDDEDY